MSENGDHPLDQERDRPIITGPVVHRKIKIRGVEHAKMMLQKVLNENEEHRARCVRQANEIVELKKMMKQQDAAIERAINKLRDRGTKPDEIAEVFGTSVDNIIKILG